MSKVFEALRKLEKESDGLSSDFVPEAQAVLFQDEAPHSTENGTRLHEAHAETLQRQFRVLPARVSVESPLMPFMPLEQSHERAGDQYRIIRTKIVQHPRSPRVMVVASVDSGDGKTVSSINVAAALALKSGVSVLLVDSDLRRGGIGSLLSIPDAPGLTDILVGNCSPDDAIVQLEQFPNLHVLPAGTRLSNPTELLDSPRWRTLAQQFRQQFNYVIMDTPPIGALADYDLIQTVSDGVLLVARPDYTNRSRCLKAINSIPEEKLIGVILNCVDDWFLAKSDMSYSYAYAQNSKAGKPHTASRLT